MTIFWILLLLLLSPVLFVLLILSMIALCWLFGGKVKIKSNKVPVGYVRWFTYYPYKR